MAPTDTFPLADRIMKGRLAAFLADAREQGQSYRTIAKRLEKEHKYRVTAETVRTWCARVAA